MKGTGYYIATVRSPSGKRYRAKGLLARGNGEWELAEDRLVYRRYLTRQPIEIPYASIFDVGLGGSWFGGKWIPGTRVVLVDWEHEGAGVRSGFVFSGDRDENARVAGELRRRAEDAGRRR